MAKNLRKLLNVLAFLHHLGWTCKVSSAAFASLDCLGDDGKRNSTYLGMNHRYLFAFRAQGIFTEIHLRLGTLRQAKMVSGF
jgi:hypothetical protein